MPTYLFQMRALLIKRVNFKKFLEIAKFEMNLIWNDIFLFFRSLSQSSFTFIISEKSHNFRIQDLLNEGKFSCWKENDKSRSKLISLVEKILLLHKFITFVCLELWSLIDTNCIPGYNRKHNNDLTKTEFNIHNISFAFTTSKKYIF